MILFVFRNRCAFRVFNYHTRIIQYHMSSPFLRATVWRPLYSIKMINEWILVLYHQTQCADCRHLKSSALRVGHQNNGAFFFCMHTLQYHMHMYDSSVGTRQKASPCIQSSFSGPSYRYFNFIDPFSRPMVMGLMMTTRASLGNYLLGAKPSILFCREQTYLSWKETLDLTNSLQMNIILD